MIEFVFVFDLMFKLQIALLQSYHAHWYVLTWIAVVQEIYAVLMVFLGDIGFVLREGGNPSVSACNFLMKVRYLSGYLWEKYKLQCMILFFPLVL